MIYQHDFDVAGVHVLDEFFHVGELFAVDVVGVETGGPFGVDVDPTHRNANCFDPWVRLV